MNKCENCGHVNPQDAKFCENCGHALSDKKPGITCPKCGHVNSPENTFCENCGTRLDQPVQPTPPVNPIPQNQQPPVQSTAGTNQQSNNQSTENSMQDFSKNYQPDKQPTNNNNNQNDHKGLIITIFSILAVLVIAAAVFFIFFYHHDDNSESKTSSVKTEQPSKNNEDTTDDSDDDDDDSDYSISSVKNAMTSSLGSLSGTNSAYFYDLNNDQSASFGSNSQQRAASDIKLFIMAAAYQSAKDGDLNLDDKYTLTDDDKVGGTGIVQQMDAGSQLSYKDLITDMITESDNTAANIIIDNIGGIDKVNDEINKLGLNDTEMKRKLMDTQKLQDGQDNMTTAKDLATFLQKLYNHSVVSTKYDKQMLTILSQNTNHSKLPLKVSSDITVYNKTGEYNQYGVQNDAAIFKKGDKAFVLTVMSQDGTEADQKTAMGNLGSDVANTVLGD